MEPYWIDYVDYSLIWIKNKPPKTLKFFIHFSLRNWL
jgi:hypothetical protein